MKFLLFFMLVWIVSCTDIKPEVNWLKNPSGPTMDVDSYSVAQGSELIVSGTTKNLKGQWKLMVKSDQDTEWKKVEDVWDPSYQNDIDLSDGNFKFKVNSTEIEFTTVAHTQQIFIKFVNENGYESNTSTFSLNLDALSNYTADANTPDSISNLKSLSLVISGPSVSEFFYKFGDNLVDCNIFSGYSHVTSTDLSLDLSSSPDGSKKLCLLGADGSGNMQDVLFATEKEWVLDTQAPPISVSDSIPTYSNDLNYTFHPLVDPVDVAVSYKYLYTSNVNDCNSLTNYSEEKLISNLIFITTDSSFYDRNVYLCLLGKDTAGNWTDIAARYSISWYIDKTPPVLPQVTLDGNGYNSALTQSPMAHFSWNTDLSGITKAYYKVIKTDNSTIISDWTEFNPTVNSYQVIFSNNLVDGEYSLLIKVVDGAGNETTGVAGQWLQDSTIPVLSVSQVSTSKSLRKSPYFNISTNDSGSSIYSLTATILNSSNQVVLGPEIITGSSFQSSSYTFSRAISYKLKVVSYDYAGNSNQIIVTFSSADCVESNPNSVSYFGGICEEITSSDIIGWKMQGGIIFAKETETKFLVSEVSTGSSSSITGPLIWGSMDSGYYMDHLNWIGVDLDPLLKDYSNSAVNTRCRTINKNSLSDWFLPNLTQLSKLYCNSGATPQSGFPLTDPNCATTKYGNFLNVTASGSEMWSNTEKNSYSAYSLNMSTGAQSVNYKSESLDYICVRSFSR